MWHKRTGASGIFRVPLCTSGLIPAGHPQSQDSFVLLFPSPLPWVGIMGLFLSNPQTPQPGRQRNSALERHQLHYLARVWYFEIPVEALS